MDYSKLPNPYDFANPVIEPVLFAGRNHEMGDVKYYLDYATKTSRPINLALIGERASGKTSVLNMVQIEAEKKGFCIVRVDLDEGDARTELAFFYKIFDSLFTTACMLGAYGGITGKTYENYRDMVDAYMIPDDRTFCPFIFPLQYAKAMSKGNVNAVLSDTGFRQDITNVRTELNRPVLILFDEGDVLTTNRVNLEKLRNIFMNTPEFMLVLTGTQALFPLMDDVFSPIVRQFKKISIGPFSKEDETEICIRKPLNKIGIINPEEIVDFETYHDVREIHDLSGGRPYEIQLICHILFRRLQEGRAKRMVLSVDVLDDVRKQLESTQDVSVRPVLTTVRNFTKRQLSALRVLTACSGRSTLEQMWFVEYLFRGDKEWNRESLEQILAEFEQYGIIKVTDGIISFTGDDFDKLYCKYFARKLGIPLVIDVFPVELFLGLRLTTFLRRKVEHIEPFLPLYVGEEEEEPEVQATANAMIEENVDRDPFESEIGELVYWVCIESRMESNYQITGIVIVTPWVTVRTWYNLSTEFREVRDVTSLVDELNSVVRSISERARVLGGDVKLETHTLRVAPISILARKVEESNNSAVKERIADKHFLEMVDAYIDDGDVDEALFHGELVYRYRPDPKVSNNVGYLHLVKGSLERARELLEKSAEEAQDVEMMALANYNLGVLEAKEQNFGRALRMFKLSVEQAEGMVEDKRKCACLLLPRLVEQANELEYAQLMVPDIMETGRLAISAIETLLVRGDE